MTREQMLARIGADQDQDEATALDWICSTSNADLIRVWEAIQRRHTDPVDEIVSRFAQVGFSRMMLRAFKVQR